MVMLLFMNEYISSCVPLNFLEFGRSAFRPVLHRGLGDLGRWYRRQFANKRPRDFGGFASVVVNVEAALTPILDFERDESCVG